MSQFPAKYGEVKDGMGSSGLDDERAEVVVARSSWVHGRIKHKGPKV